MPARLSRCVSLLPLFGLVLALLTGCEQSDGPPPMPPPMEETAGPDEVLLKISGPVDRDAHRAISESLKQKTDTPGNHNMQSQRRGGGPLVVRLSPVSDPQAFADRVDFGTVDKIEGRTLHITYQPSTMP